MNDAAGADLRGLDRFKARKIAVEKLTELAALEKEEAYTNNVGYSERAGVPIEPRLSEQWFLKYPSVDKSRAVVAKGGMKFHPDRWAKVYDHWMEGIKDWCISRQLSWGHRIPVWRLHLALIARSQPSRAIRSKFEPWTCLISQYGTKSHFWPLKSCDQAAIKWRNLCRDNPLSQPGHPEFEESA